MNALSQSFLIHGSFLLLILLFIITQPKIQTQAPISFRLIESEKEMKALKPEIKITNKVQPIVEKPKNEVFGTNKHSLTNEDGISVKAGNTLAKEVDEKILTTDDPDSIPIPTDEYLITQMPRVIRDIKIPYPEEAKKNNISGSVIIEILIDGKGKVRQAQLLKGLGYGLDEEAMKAIYFFEFSPARMKDETVAVRIKYSIRFDLE